MRNQTGASECRDGWSIDDSKDSRTFYMDGIPATENALVSALKIGLERDVELFAHDKYIDDGTPVIVVLFDDVVEQYSLDKFREVFGDCDETFSEVWNGNGFIKFDELYKRVYKEA